MEADFRAGGVGYGEFKNRLFQAIWAHFEPMRQRRTEMLADAGFVERVLAEGREKAEAVASKTLQKIRSAVGLQRSH
jgi:tryptophanyl-tRNA synthetase